MISDAASSFFCSVCRIASLLDGPPSLEVHSHYIDVVIFCSHPSNRDFRGMVLYPTPFPLALSLSMLDISLPPKIEMDNPLHDTTLSTHPFSNLRTCSLKASTSRQQSSGRRSFSRRHRTTSLRAASTLSGTSRTTFLVSSLRRKASISWLTSCREVGSCSGMDSEASLVVRLARLALASDSSLRSSAATRACRCASVSCAREESVCPVQIKGRRVSQLGDMCVYCGGKGREGGGLGGIEARLESK